MLFSACSTQLVKNRLGDIEVLLEDVFHSHIMYEVELKGELSCIWWVNAKMITVLLVYVAHDLEVKVLNVSLIGFFLGQWLCTVTVILLTR